jgi:hypothetical protein
MEEDEDNYKSVLQPLIVEVVVEVSKRPHLETHLKLQGPWKTVVFHMFSIG